VTWKRCEFAHAESGFEQPRDGDVLRGEGTEKDELEYLEI
jgi:hypothetical protein